MKNKEQDWYVKSEIPLRMMLAMYRADVNQVMMAEALGVSISAVSSWVNGKRRPNLYNFVRFCELCNVSLNEVLYGKEKT